MEQLVKITIFLVNPEGVWEDSMRVAFENPNAKKGAHKQILAHVFHDGGLWRSISDDEYEFIPMLRVKSVNIFFVAAPAVNVATPTDLNEALATARASGEMARGPQLVRES